MNSFVAPRKKRGRKSKAEKEAEARAAMEATISASYRKLAELDVDQDTRIPMMDITVSQRSDIDLLIDQIFIRIDWLLV